ncbi:hypothetical protein BD414DRAFT_532652 [Trametes punicea]|nr:hypothetical protein BD414DRAFT_532652 [Trametes punicea]
MRSWSRVEFIRFFALVISSQVVYAIPADKDVPAFPSVTSSSTPPPDAQETHTTALQPGADDTGDATQTRLSDRRSATRTSTATSSPRSILIPPTVHHHSSPYPSWSASLGHPITHHIPSPPNFIPPASSPSRDKGQPPVAIAFEVLAGVIALLILLGIARCYIVWRRTPARDRVAAFVDRHQLEREMEEMERERLARLSRALEARRWRPPPPPYQPAPAYDEVVRSESPS